MTVTPDYYDEFHCIADRCRHNCCIGWEIAVDKDTLNFYKTVGGPLGRRLEKEITEQDGEAFFRLTESERCPFLSERGLCDIISSLGDGALCDICADHPRFRSFFSDRVEEGLGLCCEEAARLILTREQKMSLPYSAADAFSVFRQRVFDRLQDRTKTLPERIEDMLSLCGAKTRLPDAAQTHSFLLSLERLDPVWEDYVNLLSGKPDFSLPTPTEQLLCYFIFRHMREDNIAECAVFAAFSTIVICDIFSSTDKSADAFCDIARMYSAEVEYSDLNLDAVFENISGFFTCKKTFL